MSDAYKPPEIWRSIPFTKGQWKVLEQLSPGPGKTSRFVQEIVWEYIKNYPLKDKKQNNA